MGLDGFSMASLGLPKDITSAQAAASTEQLMLKSNDPRVNNINKIDSAKIREKQEKEKEKNKRNKNLKEEVFQDGFEDNDEENEETSKPKKSRRKIVLKDTENLTVRFNETSETVELYNKITDRSVETIDAKDLVELISKLDYSSGILVNKEI